MKIEYRPNGLCLESKSLKLYLSSFRNEGVFCEALAVTIRDAAGKITSQYTQPLNTYPGPTP